MFNATLLQGKRILVTGGGTGLGKEMAVGFAAHGAHVYICGRRREVLDLAVAEIRERSRGRDIQDEPAEARPRRDRRHEHEQRDQHNR